MCVPQFRAPTGGQVRRGQPSSIHLLTKTPAGLKMVFMSISRGARAALTVPLLLGLAACGSSAGTTQVEKPVVVGGFYPLAFLAEQVGGDAVVVHNLTSPGVEPHDLELTARQVSDIAGASLVVYLEGMQPAVEDAIAASNAGHGLDVTTAVSLEDTGAPLEQEPGQPSALAGDPHVWLDPARMARITQVVADRVSALVPDR